MLCVSQALVASEVRDWRSALSTQSLSLKSLPLLAAWHFLHHFLLKEQARVGYCTARVKGNQRSKPWVLPGMYTECLSTCDKVEHVVLPAYPADGGVWPEGGGLTGISHCQDQLWSR